MAKSKSKKRDEKPAEKADVTEAKKTKSAKVAVPKIAVSKASKLSKSERISLLERALRKTESKLVDAERSLGRAKQELKGERKLRERAAVEVLEEAEIEEAELRAEEAAGVEAIEVPVIAIVPAVAEADPGAVADAPPLPEPVDASVPSLAWTLVQLRSEAKARGLSRYSTLTKAGLVALLTE